MKITEIEVGPHFLTFYCDSAQKMRLLCEGLYPLFKKLRKDIADIQQYRFAHQKSDPRVYHPYGHPSTRPKKDRCLHEGEAHFHIRYGYRPGDEEILEVQEIIEKHLPMVDCKHYKVTNLEDQQPLKWEYPSVPSGHQEYLRYIEDIRNNKYNSAVE